MKSFSANAYVAGTAALQPNCSRYSNENERIITFPETQVEPSFYQEDFGVICRAKHAPFTQRIKARIFRLLQKSTALYDLRTGDLRGKAFTAAPWYKIAAAGTLYALIAIGALFIAV